MIQINLLPEEFRVQEKKSQKLPVVPIGIGVGVLLIVMTIWFYIDFLFSSVKLNRLEGEWNKIQPQALVLNQLRSEVEGILKPEKDFLDHFVATTRPLTFLLMWGNEFLPDSAWLTELKMDHEPNGTHLLVKGLCLASKEKSSIEDIEFYLQNLKEKIPETRLSLTTTRQTLEGVQLTQFVAMFKWETAKPATATPSVGATK